MNKKRIISMATTAIGVILLAVGFHYKNKLNQASKGLDTALSPLSDNPFASAVGSGAHHKIKGYQVKIHLVIVAGAILTAAGVSYFVYLRQKK